ncbi:MAG: cytochrome c3 family protein [Phycisphaerales bacterium]|nr:cytochrome c3 family protein [Phycisphaerales bacterium]
MRRLAALLACSPLALLSATPTPNHGLHSPPQPPPTDSPDLAIIDAIADHYGPVIFDHKVHVGMAAMGDDCRTCHHQTEADAPVTACAECHASTADIATFSRPSLKGAFHRQCLGCHREWSHANGCVSCHEESPGRSSDHTSPDPTDTFDAPHADVVARGTYLYTTTHQALPTVTFHHDDHTQVFGLRCADCHRDASCGACHGPEAAPPRRQPRADLLLLPRQPELRQVPRSRRATRFLPRRRHRLES